MEDEKHIEKAADDCAKNSERQVRWEVAVDLEGIDSVARRTPEVVGHEGAQAVPSLPQKEVRVHLAAYSEVVGKKALSDPEECEKRSSHADCPHRKSGEPVTQSGYQPPEDAVGHAYQEGGRWCCLSRS